jgi:hypothetical protein
MRSPGTLHAWLRELLPTQSRCARAAGWELLRSLLFCFTTNLSQLARQADRDTSTRVARQFFQRWLDRPHWEPEELYTNLTRFSRRVLRRRRQVLLLIDLTFLEDHWAVLQVSIPWQQRALPLYRIVRRWEDPSGAGKIQAEMLAAALKWLKKHLPGLLSRYVLVMDRGFPSHALIRDLQAGGWRFVLRVKSNWRMTHPEHTGLLKEGPAVVAEPRLYREAVLGSRPKGAGKRVRYSQAHVVSFFGPAHQEPWYLITSETRPRAVVRIYWERMRIEQEFRDLKGPWGLDALADWCDVDRVSRFLAWVAVYEWRLAFLWLANHLEDWGRALATYGKLSWIRITREWLARQWRTHQGRAPACL